VQGERGAERRQQDRREHQRAARGDRDDADADQGRAEGERRLVGCALVGERHVHEPPLVTAAPSRDRPPAHPRQGAYLRHRESGEGGGHDHGGVGGAGFHEHHERDERGGAGQRLHQHDVALADPVGQRSREGCADGVRDREGARGEPAEAVAARSRRDEEEGAQLAHGEWEPGQEGDDDVRRAGELEEPPVGGEG
jgi:hypothetical protein